MSYQSFNPATGKLVKSFEEISDADFEKKIASAQACYELWRHKSY
jgi:succinate-semialdehyde dehydrogenase/glutarate-semialdehyde dehydrogenase